MTSERPGRWWIAWLLLTGAFCAASCGGTDEQTPQPLLERYPGVHAREPQRRTGEPTRPPPDTGALPTPGGTRPAAVPPAADPAPGASAAPPSGSASPPTGSATAAAAAATTAVTTRPEAPPRPPVPPPGEALVHLSVTNPDDRARPAEPVSFGVPFAPGALAEPEALAAWGADDGHELPAQARVLSRWPDGSVRWALADTVLPLAPRESVSVAFGRVPGRAPEADPWQLSATDDGGYQVTDGSRSWDVLQSDPAGDRVLGWRALLTDVFGWSYASVVEPESLTIVERGPLALVLRLTGAHRALEPDGLDIDFHTFTVYVHLRAERGVARVEWSLENGPLAEPPGRLAFQSYVLDHAVPGEALGSLTLVGRVQGDAPFELLQTSKGSRYELDGERVPPGPPRDLWAGVQGTSGDVFVQRVESAQNHPASLGRDAGGPLRLGLLPDVSDTPFFLDDSTRKTFRFHVGRDLGADAEASMLDAVSPAHIALDPAEVLASGAWGDAGVFYLPSAQQMARAPQWEDERPTGWTEWGEARARNTHTSGSPRNQLSVFLKFIQSGRWDLFVWNRARAWHAMDLRPYHIQGFSADEYPRANLYEGVPHGNEPARLRLGRTEMPSRFPEYKQELPEWGHGFNGFDPEHMTLDDVYECYLLTGSWPARSALRSAGEAMLTWKDVIPGGYIWSARTFGWGLRALMQVYRATGDERYLDAARRYVQRADEGRGKGEVKWLRRIPPDVGFIVDRDSDCPWMVATALHALSAYWVETQDPIVPPMVEDLVAFCMSAWRGNGFVPVMSADDPDWRGQSQALGTSTWIPGAIAAAAGITGDTGSVDRIYPYFRLLDRHPTQPLSFGHTDWHWWQAYMASLEQRHGRAAVESPQTYPMR